MKTTHIAIAASLLIINTSVSFAADAPSKSSRPAASEPIPVADRASLDKILAGWPERPRLGAQQMISKYGAPQEATAERFIWHRMGSFKRITVTKSEDHHDFPMPINPRCPARRSAR